MTELAVLPHLVRRARRLIDDNQPEPACRLLTHGLADLDPVTAVADRRLIEAAVTYLHALSWRDGIPGHADLELAWARYAETAARTCYGDHDPRWQQAASVYAQVCASQGLTFDAATMYQRKVHAYRQHGPHDQIPHTRKYLATALHADGQCAEALTEIHDTFQQWLSTRTPGQPLGGQLLTCYTAILAGCGYTDRARTLLHGCADLAAIPGTTHRESTAAFIAVQIAITAHEHPAVCTIRLPPHPQPASPPTPIPPGNSHEWEAILLNPNPPGAKPDNAGTAA